MHTTNLVREPEQVGLGVVREHAIDRVHQLLQQQQEELLGDSSRIHSLLPIKDHLQWKKGELSQRATKPANCSLSEVSLYKPKMLLTFKMGNRYLKWNVVP